MARREHPPPFEDRRAPLNYAADDYSNAKSKPHNLEPLDYVPPTHFRTKADEAAYWHLNTEPRPALDDSRQSREVSFMERLLYGHAAGSPIEGTHRKRFRYAHDLNF